MTVVKHLRRLGAESAIYGISGILARFIGVFLIPVYTRIFTPADYGVIAMVDVFAGLVGMFVVLGMDNASARWFYASEDVADRRETISSWFWCQFTASAVAAALLLLFASQLATLLTGESRYGNLIRLVAFAIPLNAAGTVLGNWLRYQRRAWAAVALATATLLANAGLTIVFVVVWRQGLTGAYAARLLGTAIAAAVALAWLRGWLSPMLVSWTRLRDMLRFGVPLVPAAIGLWVMMGMDRFVLQIFYNTSEVGLYAIAGSIASGVALITGAFCQAWGPFAYSILNRPESRRVYAKVLDLYSFLGCALCTALALFAPLILRLLTTEAYYSAASCVFLLASANLLNGARYIATLGCGITKQSVPMALSMGIGAGINLVLNFLLVPEFGGEGAALGTMIAWAGSVAYLFCASQKRYPIPYRWHVSLACFGFSVLVVAVDRWCIVGMSLAAEGVRAGLMLLFFPLGISLGLLRWRHFSDMIVGPTLKRIAAAGMTKSST